MIVQIATNPAVAAIDRPDIGVPDEPPWAIAPMPWPPTIRPIDPSIFSAW
jgi:hypothetical protein